MNFINNNERDNKKKKKKKIIGKSSSLHFSSFFFFFFFFTYHRATLNEFWTEEVELLLLLFEGLEEDLLLDEELVWDGSVSPLRVESGEMDLSLFISRKNPGIKRKKGGGHLITKQIILQKIEI